MNYIKNKWNMLLRQVNQRGLQFMISVSFTLVALVGMVFIGVFLFPELWAGSRGNDAE